MPESGKKGRWNHASLEDHLAPIDELASRPFFHVANWPFFFSCENHPSCMADKKPTALHSAPSKLTSAAPQEDERFYWLLIFFFLSLKVHFIKLEGRGLLWIHESQKWFCIKFFSSMTEKRTLIIISVALFRPSTPLHPGSKVTAGILQMETEGGKVQ